MLGLATCDLHDLCRIRPVENVVLEEEVVDPTFQQLERSESPTTEQRETAFLARLGRAIRMGSKDVEMQVLTESYQSWLVYIFIL